jgi:transposase-like protein
MKASRFTDVQKAFIIRQGEEGTPVAEVCRKAGISQATYCNWKKRYAGTFVGIAYPPPRAESRGAICASPSCTTDATRAPSRVNTLPRAIARPPALEATCCE